MFKTKCSLLCRIATPILIGAVMILLTLSAAAQVQLRASANALAQFTSQGHVLGFGAGEFLLSNTTYALRVAFVGANEVMPQSEQGATTEIAAMNGIASLEMTNAAPELSRVTYTNLWDGITLAYDRGGGILRSTYRIEPYADVNAIRLQYNAPITLNADGSLTTKFATGQITESAPIAWQDINGARVPVSVKFSLTDSPISILDSRFSRLDLAFDVGAYDISHPLYIDPTVTWNTFLGGGEFDGGEGIAVDASGNVYVTGVSSATWGTPLRAYTAGSDAFVAKLNSSGGLTWHTFLGGSGSDRGLGIAVDGSGNIYVAGESDATWGTSPAPIRAYTASDDGWVAKLNSSGARQWHTFLGGSSFDSSYSVAVDVSGNVLAGGDSRVTWGSPLRAHDPGDNDDAFVAKLNSNGGLIWHTFLGGNADDYASNLAVDGNEVVYLSGYSDATWGSPVRAIGANGDGFAVKLGSDGSIAWNTFLGGDGYDYGQGIGWDFFGNVYISGQSEATWGTPINPHDPGNNQDAFVAKMDINGNLTWNTFLGGSSKESIREIAVEGFGTVYVAGESTGTWGNPVRPYSSDDDGFVAKVAPDGALKWHTFLGGAEDDEVTSVAINGADVYVAGRSRASWGSPVRAHDAADNDDAFAAKLSPPANNDFANAQLLSGASGSVAGSNHYAEKEAGEPNHAGSSGGSSIWYRWTPSSNGSAMFNTSNNTVDTLLGIYTGSSVGGLTTIAGNDDCAPPVNYSCVTFNVTGGTEYKIAVDGFGGFSGDFNLGWEFCPATPIAPILVSPAHTATVSQKKVPLDWNHAEACVDNYKVKVKNTGTGATAFKATVTVSNVTTSKLVAGTYKWFVKACKNGVCTKSSKFTFTRQ